MAAERVMDFATAADQRMSVVCGVADKPRLRLFEIARPLVCVDNDADYVESIRYGLCDEHRDLPPRVWSKSGLMKSSTALVFIGGKAWQTAIRI